MRSKGGGGTRARQASPRALAIGGGVALVAVVVVLLVVVLSGGSKSNAGSGLPSTGSATSARALPGAVHVRNLFKGIPQSGLVLGSPNAPATLTEYIDLQCPVCQEFESTQLDPLINKYVRTGKLNIKIQPWSIRGPDSNRGQSATISAANQNRAFQFAQLLYLNQGQENTGWLNDDMVNAAAASVDGMKVQQVSNDEGSSSVKSIVSSVDNSAAAQGFNATPTLLLNHKGQKPRVASVGLPTLASLESQIQSAIAG